MAGQEGINGLTARATLGDLFADALTAAVSPVVQRAAPYDRLRQVGILLPAELDPGLWRKRRAGVVSGHPSARGASSQRTDGNPAGRVPGTRRGRHHEELSPAWLAGRVDDWRDHSVRDFARWLTEIMMNRSQRLAWRKATARPQDRGCEDPVPGVPARRVPLCGTPTRGAGSFPWAGPARRGPRRSGAASREPRARGRPGRGVISLPELVTWRSSPLPFIFAEDKHGDRQAREALFCTFNADLGYFERTVLGVTQSAGRASR